MAKGKWSTMGLALVLMVAVTACGTKTTTNSGSAAGSSDAPKPSAGASQSAASVKPAETKKPLTTIKLGIIKPKGDAGFALMASEKGFYEKYGVKVEKLEFNGNVELLQALIAGELDMIDSGASAAIAAVQKGADLKFIAHSMEGLPYALYVKKEINKIEDLKGKTIGSSKPGGLPDIVIKGMLLEKGVDQKSVTFASVGGGAQIYAALVAKKVDAVAISSEFVPQAEKDGLKVLAYSADLLPNLSRNVLITSGKALAAKSDAIVGMLAGEIEGRRYALEHRDEALALTAKSLGTPATDPNNIAMYDEIKSKKYISADLDIKTDKIKWEQDLNIKLELQQGKVDIDKVVDHSYQKKALEMINSKK